MNDDPPTLADDEAMLADFGAELGAAIEASLDAWVNRLLDEHLAGSGQPAIESEALSMVVAETRAEVTPELRRIFAADVDDGAGNPLAALRDGVGPMTRALIARQCPRPERDPFHQSAFPNDPYGLGPASFADIDPSLHEPGLRWGAARAHVHLRRRRDADDD